MEHNGFVLLETAICKALWKIKSNILTFCRKQLQFLAQMSTWFGKQETSPDPYMTLISRFPWRSPINNKKRNTKISSPKANTALYNIMNIVLINMLKIGPFAQYFDVLSSQYTSLILQCRKPKPVLHNQFLALGIQDVWDTFILLW